MDAAESSAIAAGFDGSCWSQPRIVARETEPAVPGVCPSCSATMIDRRCKRICQRCGYFESCADLI